MGCVGFVFFLLIKGLEVSVGGIWWIVLYLCNSRFVDYGVKFVGDVFGVVLVLR